MGAPVFCDLYTGPVSKYSRTHIPQLPGRNDLKLLDSNQAKLMEKLAGAEKEPGKYEALG